jgi:hypothetical protein
MLGKKFQVNGLSLCGAIWMDSIRKGAFKGYLADILTGFSSVSEISESSPFNLKIEMNFDSLPLLDQTVPLGFVWKWPLYCYTLRLLFE